MRSNILDFGIAVNFFGNYRTESEKLNQINDNLTAGLSRLKSVLIGAGIVGAFATFSNSILNTAKTMEANLGSLKSSLGSVEKAISNLEWARKKGATTPFGIEEVNSAVATMTALGFNKNDEQREEVFNAVGDLAGIKGAGFADMMQRVAKAGFGNWESLGDQYGIRRQTIGEMVRNQIKSTPDKFKEEEIKMLEKSIHIVEKGRAGTEEYRMAVVKLVGALGKDGMLNRLETIDGALSNIDDIFANFMGNLVGYSQIEGSLANAIKTTIVEQLLNPLTEAHINHHSAMKESISTVDQLGRIGKAIGGILKSVWGGVSDSLGSVVLSFRDWIDRMDEFFKDFKNNVAPIILFLYLIRLEVEDFLKGFLDGFKPVFKFFIGLVWEGLTVFAEFLVKLGLGENKAEALGKVLGVVLGTMLGIRLVKFATAPFKPLIDGAINTLKYLKDVDWQLRFRQARVMMRRVSSRLTTINTQLNVIKANGVFNTLTASLGGAVAGMRAMAVASWGFTASLLANPITWVVVAVIALVGWVTYLVLYWDEFSQSMQGVADLAITLLVRFYPIIGIPMLLAKYWKDFKAIFNNLIDGISAKIELWKLKFIDSWNRIKAKVSEFFKDLGEKFPILQHHADMFAKVWKELKGVFQTIGGWVEKIWKFFTDNSFIGNVTKFFKELSFEFSADAQKELEEYRRNTGRDKGEEKPKPKLDIFGSKSGGTTNNSNIGQNVNGNVMTINGANFYLNGGGTPNDPLNLFSTINKSSGR